MRKRDDSKPMSRPIQINDACWGEKRRGGKHGRGADGKAPFVAAVACRTNGRPLAMRLTPGAGFRSDSIGRGAETHRAPEAKVTSDGLHCFRAFVETCPHWTLASGCGPSSAETPELTWANTMLGNVQCSLHGTYPAVRKKHLGRYLGAFAHRFYRRFELGSMIDRLASIACQKTPLPYRLAAMAPVHA